jgi:hypothetical protein
MVRMLFDLPLYLILFVASGTFCFLILSIDRVGKLIWENSVFGKLRIGKFEVIFGKDPTDGVEFALCSVG